MQNRAYCRLSSCRTASGRQDSGAQKICLPENTVDFARTTESKRNSKRIITERDQGDRSKSVLLRAEKSHQRM
jgi:hypothetical protein